MSKFNVTSAEQGKRLDIIVAQRTELSRSTVQKLIETGDVLLNGNIPQKRVAVTEGDVIEVGLPVAATKPLPHQAPDLKIVYEDDDIMVVDKPAGLLVHPGNGRDEPTVADFSRLYSADDDEVRPGIVHRLDRDTSGLLILAKTINAKSFMQAAFSDRNIHKTYLLLARGRVSPADAIIDLPIDRDLRDRAKRAINRNGRVALTNYRTLASYAGYSYIEAEPQTGRTHQLRVHFAAIGHPIVGDQTYGPKTQDLGLKRHFLHATRLSFVAPNGSELSLESPLPDDLKKVLTKLDNAV